MSGRPRLVSGRQGAADLALFALMSLAWGLTWPAIKLGLDAGVPPLLLAGLRYLAAAALLAFWVRGPGIAFAQGRALRTIVSGLFTIAGTYGLIFWGMQTVPSGLSALVNLSLVPVLLFGLAAITGEERPTWRHALALLVGCAGLLALFWTRLAQGPDPASPDAGSALGLLAIVLGTCSYCLGSVIARPLVGPVGPTGLTMIHGAIGGAALILASLVSGELASGAEALSGGGRDLALAVASLAYLAVLGTILAYSVYLHLLNAWGTARAGLFAFLSPVVALLAGSWAFGETVGPAEAAGSVLLMAAAAVALSRPREVRTQPTP